MFKPDMQEAVFAILQSCIPKTGRSFEPRGRHAPLTRIGVSYGGPGQGFWCLRDMQGHVLGTVGVRRVGKDLCEIKTLFVDGGQRGRGYGRRLLGRALSFAAQSGYRRAALDTRAQDTAAIALYKSVGFYETAPYHDNPHADIFMELILEQTRLMK